MEFLEALYQQFDPAVALGAHDDRYVDWQSELEADDLKTRLANAIVFSPENGGSVHLVSGLRGTGKTSELRRVKGMLETGYRAKSAIVVTVDNLSWDGYSASSVMLKVMDAISTHPHLKSHLGGSGFAEIAKKVTGRLNVKLDLSIPLFGALSAAWDADASARPEIDQVMTDYRAEIQGAFNDQLSVALKQIREYGLQRIVVIVDELDKVASQDAHRRLFIDGRLWLKGLACDVVLTLPWEMHQSDDGSRLGVDYGYGTVLELGVIPVSDRHGKVDANATGELRAIVEKRWQAAAAKAADGPDDSLGLRARTDELICLSGGQLRVLFEIVRQAVVRAPRLDALDIAIRSQVDQLATGVDAAKRLLLSRVHETNDAFTDDPNWQNLLRNGRILRYRGDATWYDAHPLLARWLAERMERGLA